MGLNEEVAVLASLPLFANIAPAKLKLIAFASQRVEFGAGDEICRQGEAGDCAYVFYSGEADVVVDTPTGARQISTVCASQIMGEAAILADVPRTATVRARTPVVALRIDKETFLQIMAEFPDVALEVSRLLAWRLHNTSQQLSIASTA